MNSKKKMVGAQVKSTGIVKAGGLEVRGCLLVPSQSPVCRNAGRTDHPRSELKWWSWRTKPNKRFFPLPEN